MGIRSLHMSFLDLFNRRFPFDAKELVVILDSQY
jgi:hypothetical protein